MTTFKRILCLANSKKHGGTCFAGIEIHSSSAGDWIRPVSARTGHEVNVAEQTLPDGSQPQVLDVVLVGLRHAVPNGYQSENWLLDPAHTWRRVDRWNYAQVEGVINHPPSLWTNESSSTGGVHDRVAEKDLARHRRSIGLIRPEGAQIVVATNRWSGANEVRARFTYNGVQYELKVTDPIYHDHFLARGVGRYPLSDRALMTVSLAEPYTAPQPGAQAYSYKIVAAVIEPSGSPGGA
ncbi:dual OB domain-containing protein [Nocardioides gansuensis]|uniref:dual OB domain-containing protein n=1 Tax=Nocardioides gansuensis TaxID=2138300 RepID=UPI001057F904|nr:hypothetical protein [Nocardioides gansuensis]